MTKHTLLATVAALSLFGATSVVLAQSPTQGGGAQSQAPAAAPKAETGKPEAPVAKEPAAKQPAQAQTNAPANQQGMKPAADAKDGKGMTPAATTKDTKDAPKQAQDKPAASDPKSAQKPAADAKPATSGSAGSSAKAAAPPPEKRSQIVSVIKSEKIKETTNVNFNISVGTRVPSTVTFYPIPTRVIEIYPEWSGYQVILVNGRYVIVRPETYEIVYIIEG